MDFNIMGIKNLSWRLVYFMMVAFLLVNMSLFVQTQYVSVYTSIFVIYTLLVVVFRRDIETKETPIFHTLGRDLLVLGIMYLALMFLPITQLDAGTIFQFSSIFFAWMFFIVVGFSESLVYVVALPNKIGIFWTSIFFAIVHVSTNIILTQSYDWTAISTIMLVQFFMNIIFYFIYKKSNSIFLTSMFHAMFDLAKIGLLFSLGGALL